MVFWIWVPVISCSHVKSTNWVKSVCSQMVDFSLFFRLIQNLVRFGNHRNRSGEKVSKFLNLGVFGTRIFVFEDFREMGQMGLVQKISNLRVHDISSYWGIMDDCVWIWGFWDFVSWSLWGIKWISQTGWWERHWLIDWFERVNGRKRSNRRVFFFFFSSPSQKWRRDREREAGSTLDSTVGAKLVIESYQRIIFLSCI